MNWLSEGLAGDRRRGTAVAAVALALLVLIGIGVSRLEVDTSIGSMLPGDDPVTEALDAKDADFGGDPVVVILESEKPRTLLTDQQELFGLVALEGRLADLRDVAAVYGPGTVLNQTAAAAQDMLALLSGRRDGLRQATIAEAKEQGLSDQQAHAAGDRAVTAFDRRYGALLVEGLPAGLPTLRNPRFVETVMFDSDLQPRREWRFLMPDTDKVALLVRPRADLDRSAAGELVDAVEDEVEASGLNVARTTITGVPVLTSAMSDRATAEAPRLGLLALGAVSLIFLLVPWTSRRRSRLRPTTAAAVGTAATLACFGWLDRPVSLGVVAFLPIVVGIGSDFPLYLSRPGQDRAVITAALAAAVGFASLALSPLPFVAELGVALAIGLGLTVAAALAMRWVLGPVPPAERDLSDLLPRPLGASTRPVRAAVALVGCAAAVVGWLLLPGLPVESDAEQLAAGLPELADAAYAEDVLGASGEISVVLRGADVMTPEAVTWNRDARDRLVRNLGDRVHPALSSAELFKFLGKAPTQEQIDAAVTIMPSYLTSAVMRSDRVVGVMVMSVEFDDIAGLSALLDEIEAELGETPEGIDAELVGVPVAAVAGWEAVSEGRLLINVVGIGFAVAVVAVGLRDVGQAVRSLVVILLATGWVGLVASATSGALNPLTVAIGSFVVATGVEFSVLLSRREKGLPLAPRVVMAAVAGTVGYLALAVSELAVLRDFGLLLAAGVVCSLLAATAVHVVWPPALLVSDDADEDNDDVTPSSREECEVSV